MDEVEKRFRDLRRLR